MVIEGQNDIHTGDACMRFNGVPSPVRILTAAYCHVIV